MTGLVFRGQVKTRKVGEELAEILSLKPDDETEVVELQSFVSFAGWSTLETDDLARQLRTKDDFMPLPSI